MGGMPKLARGRGIDHEWRDCGAGCLLLDDSPWGTTRLIWMPSADGEPVVWYGSEPDYPSSDREALFAWASLTFVGVRQAPWPSESGSGTDQDQIDLFSAREAAAEMTAPYSSVPHHYQGLGDGRILVTPSQTGTWRVLWLGHTAERTPVLRTGREDDYPANGPIPAILGWAAAQPWGQQTLRRPFVAASGSVRNPDA
jgi:hypothetical protein